LTAAGWRTFSEKTKATVLGSTKKTRDWQKRCKERTSQVIYVALYGKENTIQLYMAEVASPIMRHYDMSRHATCK
jgi:hypothetical protein